MMLVILGYSRPQEGILEKCNKTKGFSLVRKLEMAEHGMPSFCVGGVRYRLVHMVRLWFVYLR
jgi:hypothetical protein